MFGTCKVDTGKLEGSGLWEQNAPDHWPEVSGNSEISSAEPALRKCHHLTEESFSLLAGMYGTYTEHVCVQKRQSHLELLTCNTGAIFHSFCLAKSDHQNKAIISSQDHFILNNNAGE